MKKFIGIILCFSIMMMLSSCNKNTDNSSSAIDSADKSISNISSLDENSSKNADTKGTESSNANTATETSSEKSKTDSDKNSSNKNSSTISSSENKPSESSQEINSSTEEKIEENLPDIVGGNENQDSELVLGEDYGAYIYEGSFVGHVNDGNMVYSLFKSPNTIVAFDTDSLEVVYSSPLGGRPAEVQVDGNNLLISFPDLKCIKVYNKKTFSQIKTISLPNVVSSFCIDGDIVFYSEDDQHCKVYCTNLSTNVTETLARNDGVPNLFYFPKLLLNKEKGLLYIGESNSTGSTLYYYNAFDLTFHSMYRKNNYGLMNQRRTMFLVNDNVFWGGMRFGADNAENIIGEYGGTSTYYADEDFVITATGIYETDSYQYVAKMDSAIHMSVTSNKCLVAVYSHNPGKVVVAVPY